MSSGKTGVFREPGTLIVAGALFFVVALLVHPTERGDAAAMMRHFEQDPSQWRVLAWLAAAGSLAIAAAGVLLASDGGLRPVQRACWALVTVGMVPFALMAVTMTAVTAAGMGATSATSSYATVVAFWGFLIPVLGSGTVLAWLDASTPKWASRIGALAGVVATVAVAWAVVSGYDPVPTGPLLWSLYGSLALFVLWLLGFGGRMALSRAHA